MAYRNDIFKCGTVTNPNWYYGGDENFMTKWGLSPGDVVGIKQGPNGENYLSNIDLGNSTVNGITFTNDPSNTVQIQLGWFGLGRNAQNVKFLGNSNPSIKYGFKLFDKEHFGLSWECVGDIEIAFLEVDGALMGVQLVNRPGITYALNYQRLWAHDLLIQRTINEAMYLGYVHDSPIATDMKIERIKIVDAGYDGIQTRNSGKVEIIDCDLDGIGLARVEPHSHAFLFGGNSNGGTIRNCKLKRGTGLAVFNGGWGDFLFECNEFQTEGMGIMSRSSIPEGDVQNTGRQTQVIRNNKINSPKSIECYYEENGKKISVDIQNNNVSGTINIANGITKNVVNNGPNVVPDCGSVPPQPEPPKPTKSMLNKRYFYDHQNKRWYEKVYDVGTGVPVSEFSRDYQWYKKAE
jgi:hypothetical protein